jgi:streptogramin lyase
VIVALAAPGVPAAARTRPRPVPPASFRSLTIGGNPDKVVVGPTGVWVGDAGELARVDPVTEAVASVPGATTPIAVSADVVFAGVYTRPGTIGGVDPTTLRVGAEYMLGGTTAGVVADGSSLWVLDASGILTRLDPATGAVTGTLGLGSFGFALAVGAGSVWASGRTTDPDAAPLGSLHTMHTAAVIWRVDPASLRVLATIPTAGNCDALAGSSDSVWAACGNARRVDPTTDRLVSTKAVALNGIAVGSGAAFALSETGVVTRLDAASGRTVAVVAVPAGSEGLAVGDGALWISNPHLHEPQTRQGTGTGTLLRIGLPGR